MERYNRQILLNEISHEGQIKLRKAKVLIAGVGGLGSHTAISLVAAGVGHIGLIDYDVVTTSNLHRQILYTEADIGLSKVSVAAARLRKLNTQTTISTFIKRLEKSNASHIINQYDIVIDGCDNFETRYILDDTCNHLSIPYIYGAIEGFCGQVSVFHSKCNSSSYHNLFPHAPTSSSKAIIGMTAAIIGNIQAHEAVKIICNYGNILHNKLLTINIKTMQSNIIEL